MILRNIVLSLLMIAIGVVGAKFITSMKPKAAVKTQRNLGVLVQRTRYSHQTQDVIVLGQGIVEPAQRVNLTAQVSGVVNTIHPSLSIGGRISKGTKLIQIDPTDYNLAITEARARVKIAEQEVSLETGRRRAAEREWDMMKNRGAVGQVSKGAKARALRTPQSQIAKNNLKIARNALWRAQVGYSRTALSAPFNAVVLSESVDRGQLVGPGVPIAQLAGTDAFWVTTSVPTSELGWINFPSQDTTRKKKRRSKKSRRGSRAIVKYDVGAYVIQREGYVLRQLTQIETTGRMARLIVEIPDPLGLKSEEQGLLLGAQVKVEVMGKPIENVMEIPRSALRNEREVWVFKVNSMSAQGGEVSTLNPKLPPTLKSSTAHLTGTLKVQQVRVVRKRRDTVLISEGITEDDEVITSSIPTPVPGMKLRASAQL